MSFAEGQDIFNASKKKNSAESPRLLAVLQRPWKPSRYSPACGGVCRSTAGMGPSQHPAQKARGNSRAEAHVGICLWFLLSPLPSKFTLLMN